MLLARKPERPAEARVAPDRERERAALTRASANAAERAPRARAADDERHGDSAPRASAPRKSGPAQMETFRIEVGSVHGIKPGNIVGAIANEADIEGVHIGRVDIREDHSYVDLPEGMPKQIFKQLQKVRVAGRELRISRVSEKPPKPPRATLGRHPGAASAGGAASRSRRYRRAGARRIDRQI